MKILTLTCLLFLIVSCGKTDVKSIEDVTTRTLNVENEALNLKASNLESELATKHHFYSAVEGTYEGVFQIGEKSFKTRITLISSLPAYTTNRIRTIEEITSDLNNLTFKIQTAHWNINNTTVASACILSEVRPDIKKGKIVAANESCGYVYEIGLADDTSGSTMTTEEYTVQSASVSKMILNNELDQVESLHVVIRTNLSIKTFSTIAKRVVYE